MTSVTTVVSLTLLRAGQGELLAFAFANALAKRDIGNVRLRADANLYVPFRCCVSKRKRETLPLPCSQERQTHHSGHTSTYHLLQGTRGCPMARASLMH